MLTKIKPGLIKSIILLGVLIGSILIIGLAPVQMTQDKNLFEAHYIDR